MLHKTDHYYVTYIMLQYLCFQFSVPIGIICDIFSFTLTYFLIDFYLKHFFPVKINVSARYSGACN